MASGAVPLLPRRLTGSCPLAGALGRCGSGEGIYFPVYTVHWQPVYQPGSKEGGFPGKQVPGVLTFIETLA